MGSWKLPDPMLQPGSCWNGNYLIQLIILAINCIGPLPILCLLSFKNKFLILSLNINNYDLL